MQAATVRRLMYIEAKSQAIGGRGHIGWVDHHSRCRVYHYRGMVLRMSAADPYNCFDAGSGELFLVAKPKYDGRDKLHGGGVDIDEDARAEYWEQVRRRPDCLDVACFDAGPRRQ